MAEKGASDAGSLRGPVGESLDDRGNGAAGAAADVVKTGTQSAPLRAVGMVEAGGHSVTVAEHSAKPQKPRRVSRLSVQPPTPASVAAKTQPTENKGVLVRLSVQLIAHYDRAKWKRSRVRPGFMIRRVPGYSIAETEYGVSYLWVLSRKPDRTSADKSKFGFAGYFNWQALSGTGLLCKEAKANGNRKLAG